MAKEKTVRARMTEGEEFMLKVKAAREGRGVSAVIRQAVMEYEPMLPKPDLCPECPDGEEVPMKPIWYEDERTLDATGVEHVITYTGIPAQKCPKCGEVVFDFELMAEIEKAEGKMVNHFLRYNKDWPDKISLEELSRLM